MYFLAIISVGLWSLGCQETSVNTFIKRKITEREVFVPQNSDEAVTGTDQNSKDVIAIYTTAVYPIIRKNCKGCHDSLSAPYFATGDAVESYNTLVAGRKLDFKNPSASRIVVRLGEEKHNCWADCTANAQEMQESIIKVASAVDIDTIDGQDVAYTSASISLKDVPLPASEKPKSKR